MNLSDMNHNTYDSNTWVVVTIIFYHDYCKENHHELASDTPCRANFNYPMCYSILKIPVKLSNTLITAPRSPIRIPIATTP